MEKRFNVTLHISTTDADVVALVGGLADAVEKQYADRIMDMRVDTSTVAWKVPAETPYGTQLREAFASTQPPPPEPDPGAPKAETPRKRGRVKPEVREPDPAPTPENMELPLPEPAIEGADAEVVEPVTSSTRELTRDDVFEALRALVVNKGNAAAVTALQSVGVGKFSDCPTDRLADLFDAIQKVQS